MPKTKAKAATFECFEMFTNRREFYWYVKDADGNILDAWNDELHYDEKLERMVGSKSFATEKEALAYFAKEHPSAVDFHRYTRED